MGYTLLKDREEWEAYKRSLLQLHGLGSLPVAWGKGPATYPCLVDSIVLANTMPPKLQSAYLYPPDAERLLAAVRTPKPTTAEPTSGEQAEYNRWMAALTLTTIYFCVETGLCKPAQFEEKFTKFLDEIDLADPNKLRTLAFCGPKGQASEPRLDADA